MLFIIKGIDVTGKVQHRTTKKYGNCFDKFATTFMKKFFYTIVSVIFFVFSFHLKAQESQLTTEERTETLFSAIHQSGGYGAFVTQFTQMAGKFGVLVGGYGGWFINKSLMLGGGGYGWANSPGSADGNILNTGLEFGYGGAVIEYIIQSDKLLHFGFHVLIGAAGARTGEFLVGETSSAFVWEPAGFIECNIISFARIGFGLNYRFVHGLELEGYSSLDFSGPSALLQIKFGKF